MESQHFITGEPTELVAGVSNNVVQWGKWSDWKNGYGKYTVAIILVYALYTMADTGFPMFTADNWVGTLFTYARYLLLFYIAYCIYKSSFNNLDLLVINSKGILYKDEPFYWNDLLGFQLSLEKGSKKRSHFYYLRLLKKDSTDCKINISVYNKSLDDIQQALYKNLGRNEVKDLGFTQII
jgi:hypothetical protein